MTPDNDPRVRMLAAEMGYTPTGMPDPIADHNRARGLLARLDAAAPSPDRADRDGDTGGDELLIERAGEELCATYGIPRGDAIEYASEVARSLREPLDDETASRTSPATETGREALVPSIEQALFGTDDGGLLDDEDATIPVGEFRRLLREEWARSSFPSGAATVDPELTAWIDEQIAVAERQKVEASAAWWFDSAGHYETRAITLREVRDHLASPVAGDTDTTTETTDG